MCFFFITSGIEFEEDNVPILHGIVLSLLPARVANFECVSAPPLKGQGHEIRTG